MIQTEVKTIGTHEHQVHVTVPQDEYDRIYAEQIKKIGTQAKLPGFRPGKTPKQHIEKQFGPKLHEDTVSELVQTHYVAAIDASGLMPAVQPALDMPAVQPESGFEFTMTVTTWPATDVTDLDKLEVEQTTVEVETADVDAVIERLQKSQVKFEEEADRVAENGDQLHVDFVGFIDGEAFDGGKGEAVPLVLGEGRFIPGFEEQLIGAKAGDDVTIEVAFPADYQAAHLAGKDASFSTSVKSVGKPVTAETEDDLATMLGLDDAAALRADAQVRLNEEAEQASYATTRDAALNALLEANPIELPDALLQQDIQESTKRVVQNMKQQGVDVTREMFDDEGFKTEIRSRSERGLKLSVLLQSIKASAELEVEDAALDAEIDRQSQQYPEEQRDQFKAWIKGQEEQMASMREALLERGCVEYIVAQAKVNAVTKPLSVWQSEQDQ